MLLLKLLKIIKKSILIIGNLREEDTHKDDDYKESILSFSLNRYVTEDHKNDWEDL